MNCSVWILSHNSYGIISYTLELERSFENNWESTKKMYLYIIVHIRISTKLKPVDNNITQAEISGCCDGEIKSLLIYDNFFLLYSIHHNSNTWLMYYLFQENIVFRLYTNMVLQLRVLFLRISFYSRPKKFS